MKKFFAIILVLFIIVSIIPAQNIGSDKVIIAYIILYANTQTELQQKVQNYLNLGTGWQPWGTVAMTRGYYASDTDGNLSQVMVQYKK